MEFQEGLTHVLAAVASVSGMRTSPICLAFDQACRLSRTDPCVAQLLVGSRLSGATELMACATLDIPSDIESCLPNVCHTEAVSVSGPLSCSKGGYAV